MALVDTQKEFDRIISSTIDSIKGFFPVAGKKKTLRLKRIWAEDKLDTFDIKGQEKAKLSGRSWAVPIYGDLELVDNKSKDIVDNRKKMLLVQIPKLTPRLSYIVDGTEYQVNNQLRLKPGVYTRIQENGVLQSFFNLAKGYNFKMFMAPKTGKYTLQFGTTNVALYPVLKALGVSDKEIQQNWGKDVFNANLTTKAGDEVNKLHNVIFGKKAESMSEASENLKEYFSGTDLSSGTTRITHGKIYSKITPSLLMDTADKMLDVNRGDRKTDDRDALYFKQLYTIDDLIDQRLQKHRQPILFRLAPRIDLKDKVDDVFYDNKIRKAVKGLFTASDISEAVNQTNPLEFVSNFTKTTVKGEGGIQSSHSIPESARSVHSSHFGYIDPVHTPECHRGSDEVFTKAGWKSWDSVDDEDLFACQIGGKLEFHKAERLIAQEYKGPMYGMDHGKISYSVTPNHRMYVSTPWRKDVWRFQTADSIHGKERTFACAMGDPYAGSGENSFELPHVDGGNATKNVGPIDIVDWAELMGWYLSEGSFTFDEENCRFGMQISQDPEANKENCERIEALLNRLPFKWWSHQGSYDIGCKQIASYIKRFGKSDEKYIPEDLFDAPIEAREALMEALLLGDGRIDSHRATGVSYKQRVFTTSSEKLAVGFERLAITLGLSTSHNVYADKREERYLDIHEVRILKHKLRTARPRFHPSTTSNFYVEDYEGIVYCATVPGGLLLTRRPDKVAIWSGNSSEIGAVGHLTIGARKAGGKMVTKFFDRKTGSQVSLSPEDLRGKHIAFPTEFKKQGNKFVASKSKVIAFIDGEQVEVEPSKVDYLMADPKGMFGYAANMIPFLNSLEGARAMMGSKMQEQALPIAARQSPLVQVSAGDGDSFESAVGDVVTVRADEGGVVTRVTDDTIYVKGENGKTKKYDMYKDFPLNQKAVLFSVPRVKVGDKIRKNQLLADSNFTSDGRLALGTNLRTGWMNYKGYNFEDGVVISDSASKKLTSYHLHKKSAQIESDGILNLRRFRAYYPNELNQASANKLDEDGVIKTGETVDAGDILIAYMSKKELSKEDIALGKLSKALAKPYKNMAVKWTESFRGVVSKVIKSGKTIDVYVKTEEPMGVGDKLSGRHGNKGTITLILPDGEMPKTNDGKPLDIILNPHGVPSRINISQILETGAAKLAESTGKPYMVDNFMNDDSAKRVIEEMKKSGIPDKEEVIDPVTGKPLGKVLVGPQYIMKLDHPTRKKFSARNYGTYTVDMTPSRGEKESGQSVDPLTFYALVSHGAKKNLRDFATYKADYNPEFWRAVELGLPIPAPKSTFAFDKTLAMMNAMGVNVDKKGSEMKLLPLTDKEVKAMSNGPITKSRFLLSSKLSEEKGGLFDPYVTGGMMGEKWSHYKLSEEMPNPIYEEAIISIVPNLTKSKYADIVSGRLSVDASGEINSEGRGVTAGAGIRRLLEKIDVKSELANLRKAIKDQKGSVLNSSNKRMRFLMNLRDNKMDPTVFMMKHVPVIPPRYRPIYPRPDGTLMTSSLNYLYRDLMLSSDAIDKLKDLPDSEKVANRGNAYNALKALMGMGTAITNPDYRGLLTEIKGTGAAKEGFFQKRVFRKRQDMSGRAIISPDPNLHVDEVGIPEKMLWKTHKPFIVRELVRLGYSPLKALEEIENKSEVASRALDMAIKGRPVILNRAPSLHKFGIMSFMPRRVTGEAIKIPPLVVGGFNADFDGDTMAMHVPVTQDAVEEAKQMFPSKNLFSTSKSLMLMPEKEAQLGLWLFTKQGKRTNKNFKNAREAIAAYENGEIRYDDAVKVGTRNATPGRLIINDILPDNLQDQGIVLDKKKTKEILTSIARNDPKNAPAVINKFKDIGYDIAYKSGFSLGLNDLVVDHAERDKVFLDAEKEIASKTRRLTGKAAEDKKVDILRGVDTKIGAIARKTPESNAFSSMIVSGARGGWDQAKQMLQAPVLYTDTEGNIVPHAVKTSFAEGLRPSEYWSSLYGARRGMIDRVKGTAGPGEFTKVLIASTIDNVVTEVDCGTREGIEVATSDPSISDRCLAEGISGIGRRNDVVDGAMLAAMKRKRIKSAKVRSTMRCIAKKGICQKCFGLDENGVFPAIGTNMGAISAQTMTEPTTQLTMRTFHTGGTASATGGITDSFGRINEILMATKQVPGKATLSEEEGRVTDIKPGVAGGYNVMVGESEHFIPQHLQVAVKKGENVAKGQKLSSGKMHPLEVLRINGMESARQEMADELSDIYTSGGTPVNKRHIETVVKSVTNTTQILDPKGNTEFVEGDIVPYDKVEAINAGLSKDDKIIHAPIIRGAEMTPYSRHDWLSQMAYRHLKDAVTLGAAQGWKTNIKGYNPIPAFVAGSIGTKDKEEGSFL